MSQCTIDLLIFTIICTLCCAFWTIMLICVGYDGFLVSMTALFSSVSLYCGITLLRKVV